MPNSKNKRNVRSDIVSVKCDVAATPARDHEFTQTGLCLAADEGVLPEDGEAVGQYTCCGCGGVRILFDQEIGQALDVVQRTRRQDEAGQGGVYSLRGFGLAARRPSVFAMM